MHCAISYVMISFVYFKSQVCVQMNPPRLQDKKPECFVGNATYCFRNHHVSRKTGLENKEDNPLQMILEL